MLKKITAVITSNKEDFTRKALVLGGITAGIVINTLLNKIEAPDVVVIEEFVDITETTTESETPPVADEK